MERNDCANIKTNANIKDTTDSKTNDFEYLETKRILGEMLDKKLITNELSENLIQFNFV